MQRVALIELSTHNEVLHTYLRYFTEICNELLVITTKRNFDYLSDFHGYKNIRWEVYDDSNNVKFFLNNKSTLIDEYSKAFVITMDLQGFAYIKKTWHIPTAVLIHDAFSCFQPGKHIVKDNSLKGILRKVKHKLLAVENKRQAALATFDYFIMPNKTVFDFTRKMDFELKNKVRFIPMMTTQYFHNVNENQDVLNIVIPGTVNYKSRDYFMVLEALNLLQDKIERKVNIYLLGRVSGSEGYTIRNAFEKLKHFKVYTFSDEVHQTYFHEIMSKADFFILPIKKTMQYELTEELQGKTCISGNINDMLSYAKPSLNPDFYELEDEYRRLSQSYTSSVHLADILMDWINNDSYNNISKSITKEYLDNVMIQNLEIAKAVYNEME